MNKLNAFAELIAEGKRQKLHNEKLLKEKKQREVEPLLSDMFKTVEKVKISADKNSSIKEEVVRLIKKLENDVENATKPAQAVVQSGVNSIPTAGEEKRFEKLLKQLQNDFSTLKRHVDSIPRNMGGYGGGGSGEVRIARMDDISKVKPNDGDTLVWNGSTGMFEYVPSKISKTVPVEGDVLAWNALTGLFEPVPTNTILTDEEMPFAKRVDFVGSSIIYKGEAVVGALETDPVWRVRKLILASDDDVIEVWAGGNSTYTHTWADRLTYTYS